METERKDFRMSGLEERERAVELYFTTPMTTAQVVEHLGYPTRQCLERWLAMDSRYAGHMAKRGGGCFLGGSFAAIRWRHHLQVLAHPVYAMRYLEERLLPSCLSLLSSSILLSRRYVLI